MLRGVLGHFYAGKNVNIITQKIKLARLMKYTKKLEQTFLCCTCKLGKLLFIGGRSN